MKRFKDLLLEAKRKSKSIQPNDLYGKIKKNNNFILLDIRELDEFQEQSIENAILLPRGLLELHIENVVSSRDHDIVVFCDNGSRSSLAALTLQIMGYNNVKYLYGGVNAWKEQELPLNNNPVDKIENYAD
jgi:rhodanese-related sulfurtransferase